MAREFWIITGPDGNVSEVRSDFGPLTPNHVYWMEIKRPPRAPDIPFDRLTEFRKAYDDVPSQDNEGYTPDRGGFKCGFYSACDVLQPKLAEARDHIEKLERLKRAALKVVMVTSIVGDPEKELKEALRELGE